MTNVYVAAISLFHDKQQVGSVLDVFVTDCRFLEPPAVQIDGFHIDMLRRPVLCPDCQRAAVGEFYLHAGQAGRSQLIFIAARA